MHFVVLGNKIFLDKLDKQTLLFVWLSKQNDFKGQHNFILFYFVYMQQTLPPLSFKKFSYLSLFSQFQSYNNCVHWVNHSYLFCFLQMLSNIVHDGSSIRAQSSWSLNKLPIRLAMENFSLSSWIWLQRTTVSLLVMGTVFHCWDWAPMGTLERWEE